MRRIPSLLLCALVLSAAQSAPASPRPRTITILHLNDTHSHLQATGPRDQYLQGTVGGLAMATTAIQHLRKENPRSLLLGSGDVFQGDLFFNYAIGIPEIRWMARMRFDAVALGNHDFDLGPENLAWILDNGFNRGSFPLVSANALGLAEVGLAPYVGASVIKEVGGYKVGIFGLTVPDDPLCQSAPVTFDADLAGVAARQVNNLHQRGAEIVVLLSHLGVARDTELARALGGIDVIVSAHDHAVLQEPLLVRSPGGNLTVIVETGAFYAHLGLLEIEKIANGVRPVRYELIPITHFPEDPDVKAAVDALAAGIEGVYGPVFSTLVGTAPGDLPAVPSTAGPFRDSPVGNLVADSFRAAGQADVAMTTVGLLSEGIRVGPVVPADLFRVVSYGYDPMSGFGFGLVTGKLSGLALLTALEMGVAGGSVQDPFFPQVSGLAFSYSSGRAVGERVDPASVTVGGEPIDPARSYVMAMSTIVASFLAQLGVEVTEVTPLPGVFEYTALLAHVQGLGGVVDPKTEGRIVDTATVAPILRPPIRWRAGAR